jgi:hypothetical protein
VAAGKENSLIAHSEESGSKFIKAKRKIEAVAIQQSRGTGETK